MKRKQINTDDPCERWENDARTFNVSAEHLLRKTNIKIETNDYEYNDGDDWYSLDTSNTDFSAAYLESHFTPLELFKELEKYIEHELSVIDAVACYSRYCQLKRMLGDCKGWSDIETTIEEG